MILLTQRIRVMRKLTSQNSGGLLDSSVYSPDGLCLQVEEFLPPGATYSILKPILLRKFSCHIDPKSIFLYTWIQDFHSIWLLKTSFIQNYCVCVSMMCVCVRMCAFMCIYLCACMYMCLCAHIYVYECVHECMCVCYTHMFVYGWKVCLLWVCFCLSSQ